MWARRVNEGACGRTSYSSLPGTPQSPRDPSSKAAYRYPRGRASECSLRHGGSRPACTPTLCTHPYSRGANRRPPACGWRERDSRAPSHPGIKLPTARRHPPRSTESCRPETALQWGSTHRADVRASTHPSTPCLTRRAGQDMCVAPTSAPLHKKLPLASTQTRKVGNVGRPISSQ